MQAQAAQRSDTFTRWWTRRAPDVHQVVTGLIGSIRKRMSMKRKLDLLHAKIYGNYDVSGMGYSAATAYELLRSEDGRMRYQLCTAGVDTALAILTANKPVPYYLTEGASWTDQRKAKKKAKIVAGQLMDLDAYTLAQRVGRDALVYGTGIVHGYVDDDGEIGLERVTPCELTVDPAEGAAGHPRSMFRQRMIAREQLCALYPKRDGAIRMSSGPSHEDWEDRHLKSDSTVDMTMVYEAWHLPSREGAKDGRHILCTDYVTLVDEDWNHDWFPFADMRWKDRLTGWWGCGLVEEGKAAQLRVNKLIRREERLKDLGSNAYLLVDKSSGLEEHEFTNEPLQVLPYNPGSAPPTFYKFEATPNDIMNSLSSIRDEFFQQVGLSTAQLQGEKPKGLSSAKALRTAEDIGSRRHIDNVRQYERFFVKLVKLLERLNDYAAEKNPSHSVAQLETRGRSEVLSRVVWKDVQTSASTTVRMFPVSALGTTPEGKMDAVQELVSGGYLSRPYALKLLDFPDLDAAMSLELIDLDIVHWQLERIQDEEAGVVPLPQQNLELAFDESRKVILQCEMMEASEEVKRELRRYRDNVERMLKLAMPPPPPAAAQPMPPPAEQPAPQMAQALAAA